MGVLISVGEAANNPCEPVHLNGDAAPFLIVAAAGRSVNEITGECCQPSNNGEREEAALGEGWK